MRHFLFSLSAMRTFVHPPVAGGPGRLLRDWETGLAESAVGGTVWGSRQSSWISARPRVWRRRLRFLLCESLFMLLAPNSRVTELSKITAGLLPRLDYRGRWSSESFSAPGMFINCFLIRQKNRNLKEEVSCYASCSQFWSRVHSFSSQVCRRRPAGCRRQGRSQRTDSGPAARFFVGSKVDE